MRPVLVALDVPTLDDAERLANQVADHVGGFKVGLELFSAYGPAAVEKIAQHGPVFLDLKLHDIPTTVGRAATQLGKLGVWGMTVHAGGGGAMMRAALDGAAAGAGDAGVDRPKIIGVTVLTSQTAADAEALGTLGAEQGVPRLANVAMSAGIDGIVCAPTDLESLSDIVADDTLRITPGVRPAGSATHDQQRVMTPEQAMAAGATHLVVGRPIRDADDPGAAAAMINDSLTR